MTDIETETTASMEPENAGFLSNDVKAYLIGERESDATEDVRAELQASLYGALRDFRLLWHYLSDADLERIFADPDNEAKRAIGGGTDAIVALLYLGGLVGGDDMHYRFRAGIARAEAARNNRAEVDLDIRTSEMLSPEEAIAKLEAGKDDAVTDYEMDRLRLTDDVSVDRLAMQENRFSNGLTLEEVAKTLQHERESFSAMVRYLTVPLVETESTNNAATEAGSENV